MDVPLWLALVVVGCLVVSHVGQRRRFEDMLEALADRADDAEERLREARVDPVTGATFRPRGRKSRGWTPRPDRRVEALRRLYSSGEKGE